MVRLNKTSSHTIRNRRVTVSRSMELDGEGKTWIVTFELQEKRLIRNKLLERRVVPKSTDWPNNLLEILLEKEEENLLADHGLHVQPVEIGD